MNIDSKLTGSTGYVSSFYPINLSKIKESQIKAPRVTLLHSASAQSGRDWDVKTRLLSSIGKAQKLLGYKPKMEFKGGLKKVHEWFVENRENINRSAEF